MKLPFFNIKIWYFRQKTNTVASTLYVHNLYYGVSPLTSATFAEKARQIYGDIHMWCCSMHLVYSDISKTIFYVNGPIKLRPSECRAAAWHPVFLDSIKRLDNKKITHLPSFLSDRMMSSYKEASSLKGKKPSSKQFTPAAKKPSSWKNYAIK